MKQYIGTKLIEAEPAYRCTDGSGKVVITPHPEEAFPNYPSIEDGYRVRYPDAVCLLEPEGDLREGLPPVEHQRGAGNQRPEHWGQDGG